MGIMNQKQKSDIKYCDYQTTAPAALIFLPKLTKRITINLSVIIFSVFV